MLDAERAHSEGMVEKSGWFLDHFTKGQGSLRDLNPTTRRFPRTLEEAFPSSLERTEWFYPPERKWNIWDVIVGGAGIVLWVNLAYYLSS